LLPFEEVIVTVFPWRFCPWIIRRAARDEGSAQITTAKNAKKRRRERKAKQARVFFASSAAFLCGLCGYAPAFEPSHDIFPACPSKSEALESTLRP
jgi:hypothetical protein